MIVINCNSLFGADVDDIRPSLDKLRDYRHILEIPQQSKLFELNLLLKQFNNREVYEKQNQILKYFRYKENRLLIYKHAN
jgi:hypothetical protein